METEETKKNIVITKFPLAYCNEITPYKTIKFSDNVVSACLSESSFISNLRICKIIILGDLGVGKTSLVNRFCHQTYNYNYKATIGVDFEVERFIILKVPFNVQIWDTSGQERFKCIAGAYYRSAHAIITVFDLGSTKSLENCQLWMKEALNYNNHDSLRFLVGTKRDLLLDPFYDIIEVQAREIAKVIGAEFWAVSSKTGSQVTELFTRIAALCFERIIKMDIEAPEERNQFKIGRSFINADGHGEMHKRDVNCGILRCKP